MKIGIDTSVLQTPHRMRGIGYTLINFINHISIEHKTSNNFVFYLYEEEQDSALGLLDLQGIDYEIRTIGKNNRINIAFPGPAKRINSLLNFIKSYTDVYRGDARITDVKDLDYFLQFDQNIILPRKRNYRTGTVLYDLIPYILEYDYLPNYRTARLKGFSRKGSLRHALLRRQYLNRMKKVNRSDNLFSISECTKNDFTRFADINKNKIKVTHLGISKKKSYDLSNVRFKEYTPTSWGPILKIVDLPPKKYLLFVGGVDPRRKLVDLVSAYNNLRAQGIDLHLVLAGDTMEGANTVPNLELQRYFRHSSYMDQVHFLGFVSDAQKEWLYKNSLAFVYPSIYEGFGLPILEAMQRGAPVITYSNSSITEIAGNSAVLAEDSIGIKAAILRIMDDPKYRESLISKGFTNTEAYSWDKTVKNIFDSVS